MKDMKVLIPSAMLLFLGLSFCAQAQQKGILDEYPELKRPVVERQAADAAPAGSAVKITAVCSQTKPGVVEVYLEWPGQMQAAENLRVDITYFKKGFNSNRYAILYPLQSAKKARVADPKLARQLESVSGLELQSVSMTRGEAGQNAVLQLEGLDPGKTYFWRISQRAERNWLADEVIRIEAPTCPVDYIERQ